MIANFFQFLGDGAIQFITFIVGLFPAAPDFMGSLNGFMDNNLQEAFGVFNWFVPVQGIVSLLAAWAAACLLYMAVRWAVGTFGGKG